MEPHLCALEGPTSPKGLWAIFRGRVGGPNLIYLKQLLHAALNQKMGGERVFLIQGTHLFLDRMRARHFKSPTYLPTAVALPPKLACTRYLSHRRMMLLCVAEKGDFTSGASPLCLGRAHKSQRTVGNSLREGGRAKLNLSKAVIACSA